MRRDELEELQYIAPIANMGSIDRLGILSHEKAARIEHTTVAMAEIQDLRARKKVPGGRPLHEYVNLYFHARNPMLYKRQDQRDELCVIRVSADVLDLPGVIVTDSNAAAQDQYVRFAAASGGLGIVDRNETFAEWWNSPSYFEKCRLRSRKCAEVLVPDQVGRQFLSGVYVAGRLGQEAYNALGLHLPATIDAHLFFL